ncbi:MAG: hypothetical protein ABIH26_00420 [Candidatus Eisenbacteria bacterium]
MIELKHDSLVFTFPEVHPDARLSIDFQRTLRIPDDDNDYPLPPGLGCFPLRHVDDHAARLPKEWIAHGGVMLPMYQSEAMWLNFDARWADSRGTQYPFAVKIAAGKINAVTGKRWLKGLHRRQDYVVIPEQPWLDGYCVEKGIIRQFVAMPLGAGYTAEEQITGKAEHGGLQIAVYPMKRVAFERRFPKVERRERYADMMPCMAAPSGMGLAPGGRMRQEIYEDPYDFEDWDIENTSRCFVHIANSLVWRAATGENPPTTPPTAKEYTAAGMPWFEYYGGDAKALEGAKELKGLKSVAKMGKKKGDVPIPENETVAPEHIIALRKKLKEGQVREGVF